MILVLSGEGPTDLGRMNGQVFEPGPMLALIEVIFESHSSYPLDIANSVFYYSEKQLADEAKKKGLTVFSGGGKGGSFFTRNARVLGLLAKGLEANHGCDSIAVLFRDADPTRSMASGTREEKITSIKKGFNAASFKSGLGMVPNPISEAWLVCGAINNHQNCHKLEGPNRGKNDMKQLLEKHFGSSPGRQGLYELVKPLSGSPRVDPLLIDMPSFNEFKEELEGLLESIFGPLR